MFVNFLAWMRFDILNIEIGQNLNLKKGDGTDRKKNKIARESSVRTVVHKTISHNYNNQMSNVVALLTGSIESMSYFKQLFLSCL